MVHDSGPYGEVISKDGVHWWEGELSRSLALYRGIVISSSWIGNPVLLIGGVHMLSPSYFHYLHQLTSGCLDSVGGALTSIFRISTYAYAQGWTSPSLFAMSLWSLTMVCSPVPR